MDGFIELVGPNHAVQIFGVKLVGFTAENGHKLLFSILFICVILLMNWLARRASRAIFSRWQAARVRFWVRQGLNVGTAALLIVGLLSIWFDDPTRLASAVGLVTAGLAFALQKVVTAIAGYIVILRGKTFNVGDRIRMGGVRGDVLDLGFIQTTIMEMGQPPSVQSDEPAMWVQSRQYTGRIVTVSNAKIFDEPVYNYTRDFPYLWEEMHLPIPYAADHARAERILIEAANRHSVKTQELSREAIAELRRRYFLASEQIEPRVYYRLTDNWVEMTVRFVVREHGIRDTKNAISRDILKGLDDAKISIASGTYDIVGLPPIRVQGLPQNLVDALARPVSQGDGSVGQH